MFTGLVQATGMICSAAHGGVRLRWAACEGWLVRPGIWPWATAWPWMGCASPWRSGSADGFRADVSEETLGRTTLAAKADRRGSA